MLFPEQKKEQNLARKNDSKKSFFLRNNFVKAQRKKFKNKIRINPKGKRNQMTGQKKKKKKKKEGGG